jgi:glycosyltransferase involved in cell wall biosynthesis
MRILSFVYKHPLERFEELFFLGGDVVWIDDLTKNIGLKMGRKTFQSIIAVLNVLLKHKRFRNYDVVYVPSESWAQIIGLLVAKLCKIPLIIRMRGNPFMVRKIKSATSQRKIFAKILSAFFDKVDKFTLSKANLIISAAHCLAHELKEINHNVVTVWNGVDKKFFEITPIYPQGNSDIVFGYVGRISSEKGIDLLFEAIKGIPVKVRIFGAIEHNVNFPENVEYMGYVPRERIEEIYRLFDVLVLPSFTEGLPRVIQEAMLLGKPIICTNVGDNSVVVDENGGWICKPKPEELRYAFYEALKLGKPKLQHMGIYNRCKAESMFYSWEEYVKKVRETIKRYV